MAAAAELRGAGAIVGIGLSGPCADAGHVAIERMGLAARRALDDCGLSLAAVDGLLVSSSVHSMPVLSAAEYLGIRPRFFDGTMIGGSSFLWHALLAALALKAGLCDVALIAYGSDQRSATGRLRSMAEPQPFEAVYRPLMPISAYALAAARYAHEFNVERRVFAEVALAARAWARLNPMAHARQPLGLDEVLAAPPISDPLTRHDCCLVTDGGGALVMVRAEAAPDLARTPVYLLGAGAQVTHRQIAMMPDLTRTGAAVSGRRAYQMAGLGPDQIHVVQLYDAFTINTLLFLEDLGFCGKGQAAGLVADGGIAPGGRLPVNTNGGGLSFMHPGMFGIFEMIEAVEQLRGTAGARQVPGAQTALAHGNGGVLSSQVTAVFGTGATL